VELDLSEIAAPGRSEEILDIHEALDRFAAEHAEKAELVKLRFFAGLGLKEAAVALDISEPTAKRWWAYSRAWLFEEISRAKSAAP
jgi:DNA-directed RNA polymerase specialized sigma24 family protein